MKKTVSILLVIALFFTLFGCKAAPEEEVALPLDTATDTQSEAKNQTEDKETEQAENQTDDKEAEQQESKPQTEEKEPVLSEYMEGVPFREEDVVITFTKEESAKNIKYTIDDFPELDIFNIFEFDYYPVYYHPEYEGYKTVIVMLNEPSEQNVIEAIEILRKDERVYKAEPNYMMTNYEYYEAIPEAGKDKYATYYVVLVGGIEKINNIYDLSTDVFGEDFRKYGAVSSRFVTTYEEYKAYKIETEKTFNYNEADFKYLMFKTNPVIMDINFLKIADRELVYIETNPQDYSALKNIMADERVDYIVPVYKCIHKDIVLMHFDDIGNKYSVDDFKGVEIASIKLYEGSYTEDIVLFLKNYGYNETYRAYYLIRKNYPLEEVRLSEFVRDNYTPNFEHEHYKKFL